uniref:Uncharacterized protein n=1 Tax=Pyxicephalus adspersus TaxID=30357 RepID=A0AAV2ZS76_PYXAD|nr:TPA: hypothetical protein GDO54_017942 [Pyxicephalus adspersus]
MIQFNLEAMGSKGIMGAFQALANAILLATSNSLINFWVGFGKVISSLLNSATSTIAAISCFTTLEIKLNTSFQNLPANGQVHQICTMEPLSPHPRKQIGDTEGNILANLAGVRYHLRATL